MVHNLKSKSCAPCEAGTPPLNAKEAAERMVELKDGWDLHEGKLRHWFNFKNFKETMAFVNKIADLAEAEGHHPDMHVSYGKVLIELFTHAIHGLSENDFILAAKIDAL
jgi:4a-hydroxytetrahydrobiopterin dehydratase